MIMKISGNIAWIVGYAMVFCLGACSSDGDMKSSLNLSRLDLAVDSAKAAQVNIDEVAIRFSPAFSALASIGGADSMMTTVDVARGYMQSDMFGIFEPEVKRRLGDLSAADKRLQKAYANIEREFGGDMLPAKVYGLVLPYNQAVIRVDTVMLVSLNHYLGADFEGYESFDAYRRALKTPERLPYDIVEAIIATGHPYDGDAYSTVVSRLLYEGALVNAVMLTMPHADLATALGYSKEQLEWCEKNESRIWQRMVEGDMLYSKSQLTADKLVAPSPATTLIHQEAPGRVGRYIGYKIVEKLAKNKHYSAAKLLSKDVYGAEASLRDSQYAP